MAEFSIIEKYFTSLGREHSDTSLSVGDDAAIISVPDGFEMVVSVDTMTEGIHFFEGLSPELLAHKLLAVNLSDMAAMGARPKWVTLAMGLSSHDEQWLKRFSETFDKVAKAHGVQLIGGDTTEGPLVLSLTIMGLLPKGMSMQRSKAAVGDDIYCSGYIGDAALALTKLLGEQNLSDDVFSDVLPALHMPQPQVTLGQRLLGQVSCCIDLSDGLIGDGEHIAQQSGVSLEIEIRSLPISDAYRQYLKEGGFVKYAIAGGDDYQLLFTAPQGKESTFEKMAKELDVKITKIGRVTKQGDTLVQLLDDGKPSLTKLKAFQHFR